MWRNMWEPVNMNAEMSQDQEAGKTRKRYHTPELTMLGPIQTLVQGSPGSGIDGNPIAGMDATCSGI